MASLAALQPLSRLLCLSPSALIALTRAASAGGEKKAKKERPMYLKDVLYKQAVEGGADDSSGAAVRTAVVPLLRLVALAAAQVPVECGH